MNITPRRGEAVFAEGTIEPSRSVVYDWNVQCATGAIKALWQDRAKNWEPIKSCMGYVICFARNSFAEIAPGDPLWLLMEEIALTHTIEVADYQKHGQPYVRWTGADGDCGKFDYIRIDYSELARETA